MKKTKDIKTQIKSHIKAISGIVVGYGVGELMGAVMKDFNPDAKGIKKAFIKIGAFALTGMIIKSATDYIDGEINDIFNTIEELSITIEKENTVKTTIEIEEDDEKINS